MEERIIIAGFGGQGVMAIGQLITYSGMVEGKQVSWLPSYGPEMRGGTANCSVIVSTSPVGSPIVIDSTSAIVMNRPSLDKFEDLIVPGGNLFINADLVDRKSHREDLNVYYIHANSIAQDLGNAKVANMIMLGAYIEATGVVQEETVLEKAFFAVFGEGKKHLIDINKSAIDKGRELVREQKK